MRRIVGPFLASLLLLIFPSAASAQSVAQFYRGKIVTIFVGFGTGGGYDGYAQLLARHMGRHIPGEPNLIVKHMAGAGSMLMTNYLYNVAPRDGTAFGIMASNVAFSPLIGSAEEKSAVKFEAAKLGWLGSLEKFTPLGLAWHNTGIRTLDDVKKREMRFGSSGPSSGGEIYAQLLNEMLGTKLKSIRGYRGSNDITLAIERGEVDGFIGWCWTCMKAEKPQYLANKLVNVFVQLGLDPEPEMAGIPAALDLITDPRDHQAARLILTNLAMSRPFATPPDVPAERLAALRDAFNAVTTDPEFLSEAKRTGRDISLYKGPEIDRLLKETYSLSADIVKRANEVSVPR